MKYTVDVELELPRARVIELFDNPDNMAKWQEGFLGFEPLAGEPGKVGATSRLRYKMGKREIEMIETITVRDLPKRFAGTYEADGVWNLVDNRFVELGPKRTKWISECEFRGTKFLMKAMMKVMPGAFKKQSQKYLDAFKLFAEAEGSA